MVDRNTTRDAIPRVAIVGCGRIGSSIDEQLEDVRTLSHASAYIKEPRCELVAVADSDPARVRECARIRGVDAYYEDYREMLAEEHLDIVSICTPSRVRLEVIEAALSAGVRILLCEKPLAQTSAEASAITALTSEHDARIVVNYLRRWAPGIRSALEKVARGDLGSIQRITGLYAKGLLNCGSHMLDLLQSVWGTPKSVQTTAEISDGRHSDPTLDVQLVYPSETEDVRAVLTGVDHRHFFAFELDIIGAEGRIRLEDLGEEIAEFQVRNNETFPDTSTLELVSREAGGLKCAMQHAIEHVVDLFMEPSKSPECSGVDALKVLETIDAIKRSHRQSGRRIEM